ncbi:MAG TPA: flagellar filament capping protein FliD, partial [Phycisphaerae bacterium]|nr:flagellar filament capping protein FliD [Phycisphaerae bacterium]
ADLGIQTSVNASSITSGNLERQYISTNTRLADLRGGVPPGKFRITNTAGSSAVIDLTQGNEERIQDVLDEINSRGIGVTASINANGDGILLTDTSGGSGSLTVTEEGGSTAKALGILGQSPAGQTTLDGSFEYKVAVTAGDTLQDLVNKIKTTGAPVSATILRDGSSDRPFRLSLTSTQSGLDGQLIIDTGQTNLAFSDLVRARDASVIFGPADGDSPVVLNSASNTLTDAVPNVRLDLLSVSSTTSTITVAQDSSSILKDLNLFVSAVNTAIGSIDDLTHFDTTTNTPSVLTGDSTVRDIRQQVINLLNTVAPGLASPYNRLSSIGLDLSGGNSVTLDEDKFNAAFAANPDAVKALFSTTNTGFGYTVEAEMKHFTDTGTGVLSLQDDSIQKSEDLMNQRITQLQALLDSRRQRLLSQFSTSEQIISKLQSQQTALTGIQSISLLK